MTPAAEHYDLVIVGGGINGAGIARDAAGRGLRVLLCEKGDLAAATSASSSKLIHGGLRYLEQYEFRLVAESLAEREILLAIAPHLVWPIQFVMPHTAGLRPAWMIRVGLFLYDRLGGRMTLPRSRAIPLGASGLGAGLAPGYRRGYVYADARVDDARLVVLNARAAADLGAAVLTRTELKTGRRSGQEWSLTLKGAEQGAERTVTARAVVNAAGPWVQWVLEGVLREPPRGRMRLVGGSHIVVPRCYDGEHAFILQNDDGRVVFLIPYEGAFTLVGTTDVPHHNPDAPPRAPADEIEYLCRAANRYLARPIAPADVVWSYSGVRPLYDDGTAAASEVTRDYHLIVTDAGGHAPVLSIYGGKLTTYRRLAEHALERLAPWFPHQGRAWTAKVPLPGGDLGGETFVELVRAYRGRYPQLDAAWLERLLRRHGTRVAEILGDARVEADLGKAFGGGLYARELAYLVEREWAGDAEDILWRRTKCGLHMTDGQRRRVADFLKVVA
ncbi:MAG TPA: glycerol-3-phosphate dehydrogenase [Burkholderiales bacterium]|nr:glycerol-3-phosphate dehydrogenase [Burkholderiales bacterium]